MELLCQLSSAEHYGVMLGEMSGTLPSEQAPGKQPSSGGFFTWIFPQEQQQQGNHQGFPKRAVIDMAEMRAHFSSAPNRDCWAINFPFMTFLLFPLRLSLDWALFFAMARGWGNQLTQIQGGGCKKAVLWMVRGCKGWERTRKAHLKLEAQLTQLSIKTKSRSLPVEVMSLL